MTGTEPVVAMAATPREWGRALHRHLTDHGGARLRATVLQPDDALAEDYDVLVADDATSFLTARLVSELARHGRAVLGVFDPDDPGAKERLRELGVADVVERHAAPDELLARVAALAAERPTPRAAAVGAALPSPPHRPDRGGRLVAVAGASGGVGATEATAALADLAGHRSQPAALVDADDRWATLAQRAGCGLYPNVVAGVDALARGHGDPLALLQPALDGRVRLLAGAPRETAEVAGDELADLAEALAGSLGFAVVDVAADSRPATDDAGWRISPGGTVLRRADRVVLVADPAPAGAARALAWLAAAGEVLPLSRVHVAFNRSPVELFRRRELSAEIMRAATVAGVRHLPADARVSRAAWDGGRVATGPYRRAVATLLADLDPHRDRRRRRLRPGLGARRSPTERRRR